MPSCVSNSYESINVSLAKVFTIIIDGWEVAPSRATFVFEVLMKIIKILNKQSVPLKGLVLARVLLV